MGQESICKTVKMLPNAALLDIQHEELDWGKFRVICRHHVQRGVFVHQAASPQNQEMGSWLMDCKVLQG